MYPALARIDASYTRSRGHGEQGTTFHLPPSSPRTPTHPSHPHPPPSQSNPILSPPHIIILRSTYLYYSGHLFRASYRIIVSSYRGCPVLSNPTRTANSLCLTLLAIATRSLYVLRVLAPRGRGVVVCVRRRAARASLYLARYPSVCLYPPLVIYARPAILTLPPLLTYIFGLLGSKDPWRCWCCCMYVDVPRSLRTNRTVFSLLWIHCMYAVTFVERTVEEDWWRSV
ncbi:hypothetical protein B0H17DRAFT_1040288 [Mycena rosella]|uniref:Uncharacterized protein n=1 Tax=Mycena rosella TaxID=1033263 RepID=A0AAD7M6U9_MYCRO|nr:hypothetical protein B0H17DRAFT_1040288 [Mycena rosella]